MPIHFEDRQLGKSKLTLRQQLLYIKHLRRLYTFKFGAWSQLVQFLTVGGLGTVVNLVLLTVFLHLGIAARPAVALAIVLSMFFNFVLNRRFSFGEKRREGWLRQFVGFMSACSVGALINYAVTLVLHRRGLRLAAAARRAGRHRRGHGVQLHRQPLPGLPLLAHPPAREPAQAPTAALGAGCASGVPALPANSGLWCLAMMPPTDPCLRTASWSRSWGPVAGCLASGCRWAAPSVQVGCGCDGWCRSG